MSKPTEVVISARCGAAARGGVNEDNCLVLKTVGKQDSKVNHFGDGEYLSKVFPLEKRGSLLVVADGMGGMNAGEVASQIAVETVSEVFRSNVLEKMEMTEKNVKAMMLSAIRKADEAIKKEALADKEKEGMGTTIVMLWVLPEVAYYAWCGDSRIYRYHDGRLFQLSHDHSYVCEVLQLSEAEAFDHPDNNIITRSLGNPTEAARPEVSGPLHYSEGDLFLLCSDGLCGVVRNSEISEALQFAVENKDKLNLGNLNLWQVAENNDWHDNVTSLLCYIETGPKDVVVPKKKTNPALVTSAPVTEKKPSKFMKIIVISVVCLLIAASLFLLWNRGIFKKNEEPKVEPKEKREVKTEETPDSEGPSEEVEKHYEPRTVEIPKTVRVSQQGSSKVLGSENTDNQQVDQIAIYSGPRARQGNFGTSDTTGKTPRPSLGKGNSTTKDTKKEARTKEDPAHNPLFE